MLHPRTNLEPKDKPSEEATHFVDKTIDTRRRDRVVRGYRIQYISEPGVNVSLERCLALAGDPTGSSLFWGVYQPVRPLRGCVFCSVSFHYFPPTDLSLVCFLVSSRTNARSSSGFWSFFLSKFLWIIRIRCDSPVSAHIDIIHQILWKCCLYVFWRIIFSMYHPNNEIHSLTAYTDAKCITCV